MNYSELAETQQEPDGKEMTKRHPDLTPFPCNTTVTVTEFACLAPQMLEHPISSKAHGECQRPHITATGKRP